MTMQFPAGTAVTITEPAGQYVAPRIGQTSMSVRVTTGEVIGPVAFEPGMTRVRINGTVRRVLTEYLTAGDFPCCAPVAPRPVPAPLAMLRAYIAARPEQWITEVTDSGALYRM